MAMAVNGSPELKSVVQCTKYLIESIKADVGNVANAFFEKQLLSTYEFEKEVHVTGIEAIPFNKAQRIVAAVSSKIEVNPNLFEELLSVLESQPGIFMEECSKKLVQCYQDERRKADVSKKRAGFLCPYCKKCNLKTYITSGCPHTMDCDTSLSFPFLDTKHLSPKDTYLLIKELRDSFDKVSHAFLSLNKKLSRSLNLGKMLDKIKNFLRIFPKVTGTQNEWLEIASSDTVEQILAFLCIRHVSFYNYELLQLIINDCGSEEDELAFQNYLEEFRLYCKRSVFEVPKYVCSPQPDTNDPQFALKYSEEKCIDLNEVKSICLITADILCINPWDLHLLSIEDGCILLKIAISDAIAWKVLPITQQQKAALLEQALSIEEESGKSILYM